MRQLLFACLLLLSAAPAAATDLILHNGRIWTGDAAQPAASALAIEAGRIIAVGDDATILAGSDPATPRIDLRERRVVPGINDAHVHLGAMPPSTRLELPFPEPDADQVLGALRAMPREGNDWITGEIGGQAFADPRLDRARLDRLQPVRPVMLASWTGHGTVINSAAQRALSLDLDAPVAGGWHGRDARGEFDGRLYEYAQWRLRLLQPPLPDTAIVAALQEYAAQALRHGTTSLQAMAMLPPQRFLSLWQRSEAPQRLRLIRLPLPATLDEPIPGADLPREDEARPRASVSGTKWILDGTPIEQGAALRAPYPGTQASGRLNFERRAIETLLREIIARDDQPLLHVAGDATAEAVLDAMAAIAPAAQWRTRRLRFEHGDGLRGDLLARAREYGVVVVQNPSHFTIASPFMAQSRLSGLLDAGIPLALGSDGPANPWLNMMWAQQLTAAPGQALSREQTLRAYTAGSAYAEFAEGVKGKLAVGQAADLAVLSQDVLDDAVPTEALPATTSLLTIIAGEIAWRDPAF